MVCKTIENITNPDAVGWQYSSSNSGGGKETIRHALRGDHPPMLKFMTFVLHFFHEGLRTSRFIGDMYFVIVD